MPHYSHRRACRSPHIRKELLIKDGELPVTIQKVDVDSLLAFVASPWCLDIGSPKTKLKTRETDRAHCCERGYLPVCDDTLRDPIQEKKVNSRSEVSSGRRYLRLS